MWLVNRFVPCVESLARALTITFVTIVFLCLNKTENKLDFTLGDKISRQLNLHCNIMATNRQCSAALYTLHT